MENLEIKFNDININISVENKIVTIEVLDLTGTSIGKNEYTLSVSDNKDSSKLNNDNNDEVKINPDIINDIKTPARLEESFLNFSEFLKIKNDN